MKRNVFLDTSVLISALLSSGGGSFYIMADLKEIYQLQINNYILDEALSVLDEKFPHRIQMKSDLFTLIGLAKVTVLAYPSLRELQPLKVIIETEDTPILASVLQESNYLVTLDKDFLMPKVVAYAREYGLSIFRPKGLIAMSRKDMK